jgi:hypothetical protein
MKSQLKYHILPNWGRLSSNSNRSNPIERLKQAGFAEFRRTGYLQGIEISYFEKPKL